VAGDQKGLSEKHYPVESLTHLAGRRGGEIVYQRRRHSVGRIRG